MLCVQSSPHPLYACQVGSISKVLLSKQMYKNQMEMMVTTHVYPEFTSPHGFLRARVRGRHTARYCLLCDTWSFCGDVTML